MSGLFSRPSAPKPPPVVDPADTANRAANVRLRRLNEGGAGSTMLTARMGGRQGAAPRATVTGMG